MNEQDRKRALEIVDQIEYLTDNPNPPKSTVHLKRVRQDMFESAYAELRKILDSQGIRPMTPQEQAMRESIEALVKALPNADQLELLADWFDRHDAEVTAELGDGGAGLISNEVQVDLRKWAVGIRNALADARKLLEDLSHER